MIKPYRTTLAEKLTAAIFDGHRDPIHRIALMTGNYPDEESSGGLCRSAVQDRLETVLIEALTPEFFVTLLKGYLEHE